MSDRCGRDRIPLVVGFVSSQNARANRPRRHYKASKLEVKRYRRSDSRRCGLVRRVAFWTALEPPVTREVTSKDCSVVALRTGAEHRAIDSHTGGGLPGACDIARPDVQAPGLLRCSCRRSKRFCTHCQSCWFSCLARVPTWGVLVRSVGIPGADQVGRVAHRMHERLRVVDDQPAGSDTLFQPRHEVLARWLRRRGRGHRR